MPTGCRRGKPEARQTNQVAFHSGPQGSIGAIPGLVYPCKDRAATAGIGLYILTDYVEQWISWWLAAQLLSQFGYFYRAPSLLTACQGFGSAHDMAVL